MTQLKRFNLSSVSANSVCVFIGKNKADRDILVNDVILHAYSSSSQGHGIPSISRISTADLSASIWKVIKLQRRKIKSHVSDPRTFLILDDYLPDFKDNNVRCLFMNGRCHRIMVLMTMSSWIDMPFSLNIDYMFIFKDDVENWRKIYNSFTWLFESFETFEKMMDQCDGDRDFIVVNVGAGRSEDCVYWGCADLLR